MLQKSPESDLPNKGQTMPDDPVKCANFKYLISRWCWQTSVGGHHHRFTNPLGLSFHIRCFEFAPGTRFVGTPTEDHTWFTGYGWAIAHCASCHTHLGWYFTESENPPQFFGLIKDRIADRTNE